MADALMLCPEAPYPRSGGGPLRTACILEYLASRYVLDVVTFREPGAPDPRTAFPSGMVRSIDVIDLPYHSKSTVARAVRNLRRAIVGRPPLVDRFSGFSLPTDRKYDVGVVEHFWCAPYLPQLRNICERVVLDLHNIESVLLSRCAETEPIAGGLLMRRFASSCARLEDDLLPQFDKLLVTSTEDQARVGGVVCPNAIPLVPLPQSLKRRELVFSGNMEYHPNAAAARYFAREIWPILRDRHPDLTWRLLGKNAESLEFHEDDRIVKTGILSDAIESLGESSVAVVPLLSGSGTRFKILEAWAAGLPVVSTTIGAEGLGAREGIQLLIGDHPGQFADAVSSVLKDAGLACRLGRAGREFYETNFTWPVAWKMLNQAGL